MDFLTVLIVGVFQCFYLQCNVFLILLHRDSGTGFTLKGWEFSPGVPSGFPLLFAVREADQHYNCGLELNSRQIIDRE